MELAKVTRRTDADEQRPQTERKGVAYCSRMESADVRDE
jgi:hypothetical protein